MDASACKAPSLLGLKPGRPQAQASGLPLWHIYALNIYVQSERGVPKNTAHTWFFFQKPAHCQLCSNISRRAQSFSIWWG